MTDARMEQHSADSVAAEKPVHTGARLGILLTVFLWASQYPLMHDLAQRWDPYTMILIRYSAAAILFFGIGKLWPPARETGPSPSFAQKAMIGAALAAFAVLFTVAIAVGNPVTIATVATIAPITASIIAWSIAGERPTARFFLALLLVVPGAALASTDLSNATVRGADMLGALLLMIGQASWAWYSLMGQRWLKGWSQVTITGRTLFWSCPFLIAAYLVAEIAGVTYVDYQTSPGYDAILFAVLTFGALVVGVILWNYSVACLGLPITSMHLNLIPVFAIPIAYLLGIVPRPEQIAGTVLVIAGVVVVKSARLRVSKNKGVAP